MECEMQEFRQEMMKDLRIPEFVKSFEVKLDAENLDARSSFADSFEYFITCFCDLLHNGKQ